MKTQQSIYYIYETISSKYGENFIKNFPKIANHISDYINKRSDVLSTRNLGKHLMYTQTIENNFFECCGIDRDDIVKIVHDSEHRAQFNDALNPLYNLLMVMISFYYIHREQLINLYGTKVEAYKFIRMYLALKIYSMAQRYIFKHECREDVMDYVLNHMNAKWEIVKCKNIYEFIDKCAETNNNYTDNVNWEKMRDIDVYKYCDYMRSRMKDRIKKVFRLVDQAMKEGKTMKTEDIQATNDEGKKFFTVTSSISNTIEIYCKKIVQSFIQDGEVKQNLIEIACKKVGKVSVQKCTMVINSIRRSNDSEMLMKIMVDIVSYWVISLKKDVNSIHSIDFIKQCSSAYSISNTYDIFIIDLKQVLNDIICKYSSEYINTEKKTTLNPFKQAVFLYIVFYISSLN
jgi:hypothetical protein